VVVLTKLRQGSICVLVFVSVSQAALISFVTWSPASRQKSQSNDRRLLFI
jgi:hypothetical protein